MSRIREFNEDDIPAVCSLRRRTFDRTGNLEQGGLEKYYRELFFLNPLAAPEFPSFVAEDVSGQIVGFVGVLPRPMTFRGESIMAAVATELMVAPERRGLVGIGLIRRFFAGAQELCLADAANQSARLIWERLGGDVVHASCIEWHLPLQRWRQATGELMTGPASRCIRKSLLPVWRVLDKVATQSRIAKVPHRAHVPVHLTEISVAQMARSMHVHLSDRSLIPVYSEAALSWLCDQLARKHRFGQLKSRMLRSADDRELGWFTYYVNRGGVSQVLQIVAAKGQMKPVFHSLVTDAVSEGVMTLAGRLEPRIMGELADCGCTARFSPAYVLARSARTELLSCIHRGDVFFSRVDGEWCVNSQE